MARTDYASIVLSQTAPRQQAIRDASAARQRRIAQQGEDIRGFGSALAEIPNIIKRKQADDEVKSVSAAYLGSLSMDGDHEGALQAVKSLGPGLRTTEGIKAAMGLALQANTMRHQRIAEEADRQAAKIQQAKFDMESSDHERRLRGEADIAELLQPQPDQEAMMGMSSVPMNAPPMTSPSVTDPGFVESALSRGNARMGDPGMSNLLALREQKARQAEADLARSDIAAENNRVRLEVEKAKEKAAKEAAAAKPAPYASTPITKQEAELYGDPRLEGQPHGILPTFVANRGQQARADKGLSPEEAAFLGDPTAAGVPLDVYKAKHAGERDATPLNPDREELLMLREAIQQKGKLYTPWMQPEDRAALDAEIKMLDDKASAIIERNRTPAKAAPAAGPTPDPFLDAMPPAAREDFLKLSPAEQAKVRKAMGSK